MELGSADEFLVGRSFSSPLLSGEAKVLGRSKRRLSKQLCHLSVLRLVEITSKGFSLILEDAIIVGP